MATATPAPKKNSDQVLMHVNRPLFQRLVYMWERSECGLTFNTWLAQRIEVDIAIHAWEQATGVNVPEPTSKAWHKRRDTPLLTPQECEQVKAEVIAGKISNTSPAALAAAASERET